MILPIVLTGRLGLPGGGVPNFTLDPQTGEVMGAAFWPQGSSAIDPATGEPATPSADFTNDPSLWNAPGVSDPNVLSTAPLWDTRGTQWNRRGSVSTESAFDRWRRAGKPTACSMKGIGDYTLADGTPCDPTVYGTAVCQDSTQRILNAIAAGTTAAARTVATPGYPVATYPPGYVAPQVAVSGSASPGAWIVGIAAVFAVIYLVKNR